MNEDQQTIDTHNLACDFGKHKGTAYTRLPVSYLFWMVNCNHSRADIAQAELDRRGTVLPDVDVSGHAIDRASLNCRKIWHENKQEGEGLYSWLCRVSKEALDISNVDEKGRYHYLNMKFAFGEDTTYPVLKTVMRDK